MEIIRKKICIDNYISHRNGLVPFVSNGSIANVTNGTPNGNYGNCVCNFSFYDYSSQEVDKGNGLTMVMNFVDESSEDTYNYLDMMRNYHFIMERFQKGIFLKKYNMNDDIFIKRTDELTDEGCWQPNIEYSQENGFKWLPIYEDIKTIYDFNITDINLFTTNEKNEYKLKDNTLTIENDDYIVLVEDYDTIKNIQDNWEYFWKRNFLQNPLEYNGATLADNWKKIFGKDIKTEGIYFHKMIEDVFLGKILVPEYLNNDRNLPIIGEKVPNYVFNTNFYDYINWFDSIKTEALEDENVKAEWERRGGTNFYNFLKNIKANWLTLRFNMGNGRKFDYSIPSIDVPIFLDNEINEDFILTPYEYSYIDGEYVDVTTVDEDIEKTFIEDIEDAFCESKLEILYSQSASTIYEDITGILPILNKCYQVAYNEGRWDIDGASLLTEEETKALRCGDGEELVANEPIYHNVTFLSAIPSKYTEIDNGTYYFMVAYKNSEDEPLQIPFAVGEELNVVSFQNEIVYDTIISTAITDNTITIHYAMGVTKGNESKSGIHYEETLPFTAKTEETIIEEDGVEITIWRSKIDFESNKIEVYNEDYGLYHNTRIASIIGMEVNTEECIKTLLFAKNGNEKLQSIPKNNIDLSLNRGNATAWESHYKLSECNTMEDLEKYGNNFFNL